MPGVYGKDGKLMKKFAYTKAGAAAAKNYARESGGQMKTDAKSEMASKFKRKRAKM
jgi:hypothetical protein